MGSIAVVTGASSGIGYCVAELLCLKGYVVYGLSRRGTCAKSVHGMACDVADRLAVRTALNDIFEREGRIDLIVNCAGFGISGAVEFTETADAQAQMNVNFIGTFNACAEACKYLRESHGSIINISSAAAAFPIPFQSFYSASKSAINSLTMALANELRPFSVNVAAIMLGDVRTGFTEARAKQDSGAEIYTAQRKSVAVMEKDERNGASPEWVAKRIVAIAGKKKLKPLYVLGAKYKLLVFLNRFLPAGLVNRIIGSMYMPK